MSTFFSGFMAVFIILLLFLIILNGFGGQCHIGVFPFLASYSKHLKSLATDTMAPPIGQICPRKGVWVYKVIGYIHTNIIFCHTKLITVP